METALWIFVAAWCYFAMTFTLMVVGLKMAAREELHEQGEARYHAVMVAILWPGILPAALIVLPFWGTYRLAKKFA